MEKQHIEEPLIRILESRHHDPFEVLGKHILGEHALVRAFLPLAERASIVESSQPLKRIEGTDFFEWYGTPDQIPERYCIAWSNHQGQQHSSHDPYCFPEQLEEFDLHLFNQGKHWHAYNFLGAHAHSADKVEGVLFSVWAPNAERVSVIGDFNNWDGRVHPMRSRGGSGVWELFIPAVASGNLYRFELRSKGGEILVKNDPYGTYFQKRPDNAGIIATAAEHSWNDQKWMTMRAEIDWQRSPMSVYEVHLGSWQQGEHGEFLNYREIAQRLAGYILELGFTHVELLPITEHPYDASWGYQTTGYFAPTSRFGNADDFRYFVDYLHQRGIGVLLDWVPAHFPKDSHALARFDGSALYEHEDPRKGEHRDWGTLIFNYGREEVCNFLLTSAVYWLEEFHLDGLRVDAVASMLYLDYSREAGDWVPNKYGGRENLEAVDFLRHLNAITHEQFPGTLMVAEESTSWPQVSRPTWLGGLGFSMKWNMGWMHDSLSYMSKDPVFRHFHHDLLTFGLLYCFTENFVLPFSHDEVVHGKGSMLAKMSGDDWQRFATLRLLYGYMFTYPGKKLLFMGNEFAQGREWNEAVQLDWHLMDFPQHQGMRALVSQLNHLYREVPALHELDFEAGGFEWIDCHDASQSVLSFLRWARDGSFVVVILNFTPVPRENYRIGLPKSGAMREIFNSDSAFYDGSNMGNNGIVQSESVSWMGQDHSMVLTLPPLGMLILDPRQAS
ncbi:MAG: 1,4-alpha-glucan branching protein GlgB [Gammaproteobacteria bacterium]|nr:1,4-alpha-glucan branching protein GlgB [Gammaproteobacteria bacterium]